MGLTVKEIKEQLETYNKETSVILDFTAYPSYIDSWRGSYDQPALFWSVDYLKVTVADMLVMLDIDGEEVTGYKGGEYTLDENDILRLCNNNHNSGATTISKISKGLYAVVLHTQYEEY